MVKTSRLLRSSSVAGLALALAGPAFAQDKTATGNVIPSGETSTPRTDAGDGSSQKTQASEAATPSAGDATTGGDIVVTGLRQSLASAQNLKRNAVAIVDALVAEDIGKFPDNNAAEALARVTGVQVERFRDEANSVVIRGLPNVQTTLQGREIFTADGRTVSFQDFPAQSLAKLEVFKNTTAENLEGGIAGLINIGLRRERGAGDRFHGLARAYLLDDTYFNPLADGRNVLPGRHAYSHVNALASAMRAYMVDGDPRHLAAARNGLQFVLDQSWATGGWGPNESFVEPGSGGLGNSLTTTHSSFEAPCGTYGHFKVARYLMRATGDSRYGDAMEKLMYNASLGALPLRPDGSAYYYADYSEIGAKSYFEYNCPCCSGSIGQLAADYGPSAYLRDDKGVFVNLYIPSRVVWRRDGAPALTLTQQGGYPLGSDIAMAVEAPRPVKMALRLRIPAWAGPQTRLLVNGRAVGGVAPGRFAVVAREWRNGDKVALSIDRPLRLEPVDAQHPARVAAMQGPLALFAMGDRFVPLTSAQLLSLKQTAPGAAEWTLAADVGRLRFYPSSAIGTEPTRLYQFLI